MFFTYSVYLKGVQITYENYGRKQEIFTGAFSIFCIVHYKLILYLKYGIVFKGTKFIQTSESDIH